MTILLVVHREAEEMLLGQIEQATRQAGGRGRYRFVVQSQLSAVESGDRSRAHAAIVDRAVTVASADASDTDVPGELVRFLSGKPALPTALWACGRWLRPRRVLALAHHGLREVIVREEEDDPITLGRILFRLLNNRRAGLFVDALPPSVPREIAVMLTAFVRPSIQSPTPDDMARALHCERTTLYRKFARAGLPGPGELIIWVRVYLVLHLLDEGVALERASMLNGFPSTSAFLASAARRTGTSDQAVLRRIGHRGVLDLLRADIIRRTIGPSAA